MAAPRGSAMPMAMSFFRSRRYSETPAIVPPVPMEQMKPSILPCRLLPDFRPGRNVVGLAVVEVVPLVGEEDAVRLALAQGLGRAPADVLVVVGVGVGHRGHLHQLRAVETQDVLLLAALRLGDHDQRAVAARVGDEREADAGVPRRRFDHQAAGLDLFALLGLEDHLPARPVLDRLARVHELGLAEYRAAGQLRRPLEPDERRVADRVDGVVPDIHRAMLARRGGARPTGRPHPYCANSRRRRLSRPSRARIGRTPSPSTRSQPPFSVMNSSVARAQASASVTAT